MPAETLARQRHLERTDWVRAGLDMLVQRGIDAVQITRLARHLDVTRGSFYWHFKDRDDLLEQVVAHWRQTNTDVMVQALDGQTSLTGGILSLFTVWTDPACFDPALEQAMRDWARLDAQILGEIRSEDAKRVDQIARFFEQFGYAEKEAHVRARVLYFAQIGYYALNLNETIESRLGMLEDYYLTFTGRVIDPTLAAQFEHQFEQREQQ